MKFTLTGPIAVLTACCIAAPATATPCVPGVCHTTSATYAITGYDPLTGSVSNIDSFPTISDAFGSFTKDPIQIPDNHFLVDDGYAGNSAFIQVSAESTNRTLKVFAYAQAIVQNNISAGATATATFTDRLTFEVGEDTRRIRVHGDFKIHGFVGVLPNGLLYDGFNFVWVNTRTEAKVRFGGTGITPYPGDPFFITRGILEGHSSNSSHPGIFFRDLEVMPEEMPFEYVVDVINGKAQPLDITYTLSASASASGQTSYFGTPEGPTYQQDAKSDYSHTVTWGGITSVIDDATGESIQNWNVTAASGLDYKTVVPEPSTMLLSVGSVVLLSARRRHRS